MYFSVKNLKLLIPSPHNPNNSQPAILWITVVAPSTESEAKLAGNPQRGFVWSHLILVGDIDPFSLLIVIHYDNLYLYI